jgi:hypothetical protein
MAGVDKKPALAEVAAPSDGLRNAELAPSGHQFPARLQMFRSLVDPGRSADEMSQRPVNGVLIEYSSAATGELLLAPKWQMSI